MSGFFETLIDEMAIVTYAQGPHGFFIGLFHVRLSKSFEFIELNDDFQPFMDIITGQLSSLSPFRWCGT